MSKNPPKTIIISCDGTGENSDEKEFARRTNCHKLPYLLKEVIDNGRRPILWTYEGGLGTSRNVTSNQGRFLKRVLKKYKQRYSGEGFEAKVIGLYYLLAAHWEDGDELMLFGFSRGAYVVRILGSFIADMKILNRLWFVNRTNKTLRVDKLEMACERLFNIWAEGPEAIAEHNGNGSVKDRDYLLPGNISVIGVYDTVASLGSPDTFLQEKQSKQYKFAEQIEERPAIKHFFQALALAERRINFKPVMMDKIAADQVAVQTWFPFFHSSVGGDVGEPGQRSAQICLLWMLSRLLEHRLLKEKDLNQVELRNYLLSASGKKPPTELADMRYKIPFSLKPGILGDHYRNKELDRRSRLEKEYLHVTVSKKGFKDYLGIKKRPSPVAKVFASSKYDEDRFEVEELTDFEERWLDEIAGNNDSFIDLD